MSLEKLCNSIWANENRDYTKVLKILLHNFNNKNYTSTSDEENEQTEEVKIKYINEFIFNEEVQKIFFDIDHSIMDMNIFEGMRTLAANIAVEVPEAEVDSSHYRVLFLAAFVLFSFTFVVNTGAEIIRHRLRKKYGSL